MLRLLLNAVIRHHHQVNKVRFEVVGPTMLDFKAAQARARRDALCIPAWEPYGKFARPHTDVAATWRARG